MMDNDNLGEVIENLSEEELEEYREIFSFFDKDGGGSITSVELGDAMKTLGLSTSEEVLHVSIQAKYIIC